MALKVDWRQVRRWGIAEAAIPGDAVVQFREDSLWQAHRGELTAAALVFLIQAALIAALVFERRRRRLAELATNRHRAEFAHASRLAVAGELTASIAHEINQPLGAILANADTAELLLESGADRLDDLRRIVADIRRDDLRAAEIIRRLRALLSKQQAEHQAFDLNVAVRDMESLLRPEVKRRGMALELRLAPCALTLVGDRIQIQQVLINLVLNAMDAMAAMSEPRRTVVVATQRSVGRIGVTVRDRGTGIAAEDLPKIFDSFFSTKRAGMGLGLAIARTLVEARGGHIRAENGTNQGAVFHVEWPAAAAADMEASGLA
jgi:C4-dicarboxylate-specific signal transduction histidine kinase